jgi:GrpB-like predicted nucleotidyltransferase (UPF0157 family)
MRDDVLIGGREKRDIVIAEYDPEWVERYARERAKILGALGSRARLVEHIGSTSVPGLAAKPIVDVLVAVDDPEDDAIVRALEGAGYVWRVREPGHRMVRTPELDVHVHIWQDGSEAAARDLAFRDRLRASAADREAYERLKRELAGREWDDMNDYARAKGPLIEEILRRAATRTGARRSSAASRGD